ncbi:unnamed protein product [Urochloa humidicola]
MASSPAARRIAGARAAQTDLPDEILEDIFVRLDSVADLARASAACTTFRRVVSTRPFLRRYRSLHAPPVVGGIFAERGKFYPAEPPHRSAPAAGAVARAADFTFSFLPKRNRWRTLDVRDGRVLLSAYASTSSPKDLVICDPLHRRYVLSPLSPMIRYHQDDTSATSKISSSFSLQPARRRRNHRPSKQYATCFPKIR